MSLEALLEQKKKALEDVIGSYRAFLDALRKLPTDWAREVIDDLAIEEALSLLSDKHEPSDQDEGAELPLPSEAVCALLAQHTEGLTSKDIIAGVTGKFRTSSTQPVKLLYSTLQTLKRTGKIEQGSDSLYRLKS